MSETDIQVAEPGVDYSAVPPPPAAAPAAAGSETPGVDPAIITRAVAERDVAIPYRDWSNGAGAKVRVYPLQFRDWDAHEKLKDQMADLGRRQLDCQSRLGDLGAKMDAARAKMGLIEGDEEAVAEQGAALLEEFRDTVKGMEDIQGEINEIDRQHFHCTKELILLVTRRAEVPSIEALYDLPGNGSDGLFTVEDFMDLVAFVQGREMRERDLAIFSTPPTPTPAESAAEPNPGAPTEATQDQPPT